MPLCRSFWLPPSMTTPGPEMLRTRPSAMGGKSSAMVSTKSPGGILMVIFVAPFIVAPQPRLPSLKVNCSASRSEQPLPALAGLLGSSYWSPSTVTWIVAPLDGAAPPAGAIGPPTRAPGAAPLTTPAGSPQLKPLKTTSTANRERTYRMTHLVETHCQTYG